jgi:hypothetical protein
LKTLIKVVVTLALGAGLFVWGADRCETAALKRQARERGEFEEKKAAEENRAALIAAPPQAGPAGQTVAVPEINRQAEQLFRQLADEHDVEVHEYRAVAWREVVVTLQTRNQNGIGDLLREAIFEDIIWEFDLEMQERNSGMIYEQGTAARIWHTRFTMKIEMP